MDPSECGTYLSGIICEECGLGTSLPCKPTDVRSPWKCGRCQVVTPAPQVMNRLLKVEARVEKIKFDNDAEVRMIASSLVSFF